MRPSVAVVLLALAVEGCIQEKPRGGSIYQIGAQGRLDSRDYARLVGAETVGVISAVRVVEGSEVREGDDVVILNCQVSNAAVQEARSSVAEEKVALKLLMEGGRPEDRRAASARVREATAVADDARDFERRVEALSGSGAVSDREISGSRAAAVAASAREAAARAALASLAAGGGPRDVQKQTIRVQGAEARLDMAKAEAAKCVVKSPINGTIVRVFRHVGERTSASVDTPLFEVANLNALVVRAEIDERDASNVRVGQLADFWLDGRPQIFHGRVSSMSYLMGRRTKLSSDPADRSDNEIREVEITPLSSETPSVVGLRVTVGIR